MLRPRRTAVDSNIGADVDNSEKIANDKEEDLPEKKLLSADVKEVPETHPSASSTLTNVHTMPLMARWVVILSIMAIFFSTLYYKKETRPVHWWTCLFVLWIPVGFALALAMGYGNPKAHQRLIAGGSALAVLGNELHPIVSIVLVCAGIFLFGLASRPDLSDASQASSNKGKLKAVYATLFMILVLIFDNFFVWVVSATFTPSHKGSPEPLQDNGRIIQQHILEGMLGLLRRQVVEIRAILNVQWVVAAAAGLSFAAIELGMVKSRTLHGVAIRGILTIAALRSIRIVSYMLTVLPSQNPRCYRHRFPPPPEDWQTWIMVGFRPQAHGGCNDLIVSGHATIITSLACLSTSVAGHSFFSFALWSLVAIDYAFECYEGFHYSVDMWMGALIGTLLWRLLADLENIEKSPGEKKLLPMTAANSRDIALYAAPAILVFIVIVILPRWTVIFWVILFSLFAGQQILQHGFTQYVQHTLFCLMFMALSVYL